MSRLNRRSFVLGTVAAAAAAAGRSIAAESPAPGAKVLRAGIIGMDTSHVMAFSGIINDPKAKGDLAGVRVVAGFPGGTRDNPSSWDRVGKITEEARKAGLEIVDSIPALLAKVDVVLVESVDGRPHLEQIRPCIEAGKPTFVDKPCAGTLADVLEIFRLAKEKNVPIFSSSSLRFGAEMQGIGVNPKLGAIRGCDVYGPCSTEPHHPDLFWYGIHGVEMLFTVMGTGCKSVTRVHAPGTDLAAGLWADGRMGTFRGIRDGKADYGGTVFGAKAIAPLGKYGGYVPLVREICKFFKTGRPPVAAAETIEIFAFMEAADESKRQGGAPVTIESVLAKAGKKT